MMRIDLNKTYQTKAGHDVQLFTTGAPEPYPVVGIRKTKHGNWMADHWTKEGKTPVSETYSKDDLVEVKPKRLVYVNLYSGNDYAMWDNREDAEYHAGIGAVAAAVPVYIEEEE